MKWIIMAVIAVVLIGGGVGGYVLMKDDDSSQASQTSVEEGSSVSTEQASVEDLLSRNASLKCTYNVQDGDSTNTGTAYFSGEKKMYGEFTNKAEDSSNTAYVIRNGDTQYVWQKDSSEGYKTDVSASNKESQQEKSQSYDPEKEYEFKCTGWTVDSSRFSPPSSVKFQDISAQLEQAKDAAQSVSNVCEKIADPTARAACQNAL